MSNEGNRKETKFIREEIPLFKEEYPEGRKRATKACLACKSKHTKCGFVRPCLRCQFLGIDCVDDIPKKRGSKQKGSVPKYIGTKRAIGCNFKESKTPKDNQSWTFSAYSPEGSSIAPQQPQRLIHSTSFDQATFDTIDNKMENQFFHGSNSFSQFYHQPEQKYLNDDFMMDADYFIDPVVDFLNNEVFEDQSNDFQM
eukprot:gene10231-2651_t